MAIKIEKLQAPPNKPESMTIHGRPFNHYIWQLTSNKGLVTIMPSTHTYFETDDWQTIIEFQLDFDSLVHCLSRIRLEVQTEKAAETGSRPPNRNAKYDTALSLVVGTFSIASHFCLVQRLPKFMVSIWGFHWFYSAFAMRERLQMTHWWSVVASTVIC